MSRTAVLSLILLALAAAPGRAQTEVHRSAEHDYRIVTVVEGLQHPWSIAFLPDGDMLVTERPGRLRIVRGGRLLPEPVPGLPEIRSGGQGGLLDVVPHPDFARNRLLYLTYSKPNADGSQGTTAVIRGRFENDRLTSVEEIFEAHKWAQGRGHYGARIAFDRDGYLFVSLGDRQYPPSGDLSAHPAQSLRDHVGTIVRLHDDGRVPADNPFAGRDDALPEIWSWGHRNGQGLAVRPGTNEVWQNEHGPQGGDELNLILPGGNYGWPVVGYGVNYRTGAAIHAATQHEEMENPAHIWVPSIAPSGLLFYTGDSFPRWRDNAFVGGLAGQQLARLTLDGGRVVAEETLLRGFGRVRDVRQGPDGYIYLAIDDRSGGLTPVVRLEPVERR
jgi:aldose sugar dehydrogenase